MSNKKPLTIDFSIPDVSSILFPCPPVLNSHEAGWENIYLAHYQLPAGEIPEVISPQHTIVLPTLKRTTEVELVVEEQVYITQYLKNETDCIAILPANVSLKARWNAEVEFIHCYLEAKFLTHVAYESANPDSVEIVLTVKYPDPLVWQIGSALKSTLESNPSHSRFYAESMATALAAHCLKYYSIRKHNLRDYEGGLPKNKLTQALEYINEHLHQDLSLIEISTELGISQYYFSRLFKQSTGMTPHGYLVQQRVERSKQLLKQSELTMAEIALRCGFANSSHLAKCFRKVMGRSLKEFRNS